MSEFVLSILGMRTFELAGNIRCVCKSLRDDSTLTLLAKKQIVSHSFALCDKYYDLAGNFDDFQRMYFELAEDGLANPWDDAGKVLEHEFFCKQEAVEKAKQQANAFWGRFYTVVTGKNLPANYDLDHEPSDSFF